MGEIKNNGVSRRSFLQGMGLAGAAALAAGVATGCSSQPSSSDLAETGEQSAAGAATPGYASTEDWLGEAPQIADDEIVETIDCGGGV